MHVLSSRIFTDIAIKQMKITTKLNYENKNILGSAAIIRPSYTTVIIIIIIIIVYYSLTGDSYKGNHTDQDAQITI